MSLIALCLSVMSGDALAGPAVRPTPFLDAVDLHLSHAAVGAPGETEGACLTGLVEEMRGEWATIPAEERAAITARLAPWKADLFAPMVRDTPMPPWGTDSCWGQQYDNRLVGRRFVVEWEDGVDEDDARSFLEALEYSYDVEVDDLGWNAPDGIDDYLMAAFITNDPRSAGAYTTVEQCGNLYMPYIVASSGSWFSSSWADTMAAHEFNHAIQFSYGFAWEFWYWEATATWMEEHVYPASNEWYSYITGYTDNPWMAMSASDQQDQDIFWHMYGMAIWPFHLDQRYGGQETVRGTWEAAENERGQYTFGMLDAMPAVGLNMEEVYLDFIVRNVDMDYDERMPAVGVLGEITSLPSEQSATRGSVPESYGQNYWNVRDGLGQGDLLLTFDGDNEADWAVGLVEHDNSGVLRTEMKVLGGTGEVRLSGYGAEEVAVVISPMTTRTGAFEYTFQLEVVEAGQGDSDPVDSDPAPGDTDPAADDTGLSGSDDTGDIGRLIKEAGISLGGACACSAATPAGAAGSLAVAAGLALLIRRRR